TEVFRVARAVTKTGTREAPGAARTALAAAGERLLSGVSTWSRYLDCPFQEDLSGARHCGVRRLRPGEAGSRRMVRPARRHRGSPRYPRYGAGRARVLPCGPQAPWP